MQRIESPRVDDAAIEAEIRERASVAPRVTPADIEANISSEHYFTAADGVAGAAVDAGEMVNRFLACSLPASVCADLCATDSRYPHARYGTNLLTADETRQVLDQVVVLPASPPALGQLTFCVLVLCNGFTVTGESAVVSAENFDADIGRKVARQNAVNKVWPLLGHALVDRLHQLEQAK